MMTIHVGAAFALVVAFTLGAGCARFDYTPVQEIDFDRLATDGCTRSGERFSTTAQISNATRETIVLAERWNGSRTVAVRLPKQGTGSRLGAWFGESRYDVSFKRLNELRGSATPVTVTMRCESANMAPEADRFSFIDKNGRRVEFEF